MKKIIIHHEGVTASAVTGQQYQTPVPAIKLGLDIHQARYVVVAQEDHATPKPARSLRPAEFVPWVRTLLARGHAVFVVYEACGFGFGLQRQLTAAGATCYVIAPQKLDEARKGVKTDALDAGVLCQRLSRYVAGNKKELAVIRVPREEEEQHRHVHRQREAARPPTRRPIPFLLLAGPGADQTPGAGPRPARHPRPAGAPAVVAGAGRESARHAPARLAAGAAGSLPPRAPGPRHPDRRADRGAGKGRRPGTARRPGQTHQRLAHYRPPLVPSASSVVVSREVCDWHRFKNRRQVSSYTGLCPGEYSSGGKRMPGSVTKHGNPRLRAALVELAWRLVRFQPQYPPVHKRLAILAKGARATGAARKKAIVCSPVLLPPLVPYTAASAVARQLAVDLWRWQTGQCSAAQLGLQP